VELAYGLQCGALQLGSWHKGQQELRYHRLRAELRYYQNPGARLERFVAAEGFFVPQRYTISSYHERGTNYSFEPTQVQRDVWGLALNYGLQWHMAAGWQLEAALGLGLRHLAIRYEPQHVQASSRGSDYEGLFERSDVPGTAAWGPHLTARIKVGFGLGRR
jgi:hypothetical protein